MVGLNIGYFTIIIVVNKQRAELIMTFANFI